MIIVNLLIFYIMQMTWQYLLKVMNYFKQNLMCYKFTVKGKKYVLTSVRVKLLYSMLIRAKLHLCIITVIF